MASRNRRGYGSLRYRGSGAHARISQQNRKNVGTVQTNANLEAVWVASIIWKSSLLRLQVSSAPQASLAGLVHGLVSCATEKLP